MSFWKKGQRPPADRPDALPACAVPSIGDAESVLVLYGKKGYDGVYILPGFTGTLDELWAWGRRFKQYATTGEV